MNSLGFNFQTLRQLGWFLCHPNGLLKDHYVIYGLPDIIECPWIIGEDFHQVAILFDPIGEGPCQMAEGPVTFNSFLSSDLIVVQHKEVLQFSKATFNFPTESVQIDDPLHRKPRVVCDQNMYFLRVFASVRSKENNEFQGYTAVLELTFEVVGFNGIDFPIRSYNSYWLYFVPVMFFDEGNELVLLHEAADFLYRMIDLDVPIGLDFTDNGETLGVQSLDQVGRMGIPGIENDGGKTDILFYGILDEILGQLDFASKTMQGLLIKLLLFLVESEINGKGFGLRGKGRRDEDVANGLFPQDAAVLIPRAFRFLGVYLGTGGIIDNQNTVRCRSGCRLSFNKSDSLIIELFVIPLGFRKEVLQPLVIAGSGFGDDFHIGAFHVFEQNTDVKAEIEELALRKKTGESPKKLVDESTVGVEDMHDLCSSAGSDRLFQLPTIQRTRVFFYGTNRLKASNECKLRNSELTFMDLFEMPIF